MSFVNEYVSEEDLAKYPVAEIWSRYHGAGPRLPGFQYKWTVDRSRNAFLLSVKTGREELSSRFTFVLWIDGQSLEFDLDSAGSGSLEGAVVTTWSMAMLNMPAGLPLKHDNVLSIVKEAISAYQRFGILLPIQQHTAVFKF